MKKFLIFIIVISLYSCNSSEYKKGIKYYDNNEYDKAISHLKKAISLDSNYPEAHYRLGLLYLTIGKLNQGKLELEKALKIKPDLIPAMEALKALKK